ncbi:MAG: hypothetical protein QM644_08840 [Mobilitalea sp.]
MHKSDVYQRSWINTSECTKASNTKETNHSISECTKASNTKAVDNISECTNVMCTKEMIDIIESYKRDGLL